MKKIIVLFMLLFIINFAQAKTADSKNFYISADNAFMLSLDTLDDLNFKIEEMQSSSGYILFKTPDNNEYLLMVSEISKDSSNIKIIKANAAALLTEIQELFYSTFSNKINDLPKKVQ